VGQRQSLKGFTIVELLIVIVVIAILAAITVVAYTGISNRAYEASVQSDLRQDFVQMRLWKAEHNGTYPGNTTQLAEVGIKVSSNAYYKSNKANFYYCVNSGRTLYAFVAQAKTGKAFVYISNEGIKEYNADIGWSPTTAAWPATCEAVGDGSFNDANNITGMSYGNWASWVTAN
jgi:general secretion pathway protein G